MTDDIAKLTVLFIIKATIIFIIAVPFMYCWNWSIAEIVDIADEMTYLQSVYTLVCAKLLMLKVKIKLNQ